MTKNQSKFIGFSSKKIDSKQLYTGASDSLSLKKKKKNKIALSKSLNHTDLSYGKNNYFSAYWEKKRLKRQAIDKKYGFLSLKCSKRNIYFNLSDSRNRLRATMSTGYIKVKGKARRAIYVIKKLGKAFLRLILASKLKRIHLSISGFIPRKIKRIFLKIFKTKSKSRKRKKAFKFCKYTRYLRYPHNGCRPSKIRRR